jgi:pimeloyl-ACP methyl ester carboxylesterase
MTAGYDDLDAILTPPRGDERRITTPDGAVLRVLAAGQGPSVLLVNGFGVGIEEWSLVWPELVSRGYRVYGYDARGQGQSTPGSLGVTATAMRNDFTTVIAALDLDRVTVVSHSMGNFIALAALAHDPDSRARIGHYVAVAPITGDAYKDAITRVQGPLLKLGLVQALSRNKRLGRAFARPALGLKPSDTVVEAWRRGLTAVPKAVTPMLDALRDETLADHLGDYDLPMTVLIGSHDVLTPYRHARLILNSIPSARLRYAPQAGHILNWESPGAIVELVEEVTAAPRQGATDTGCAADGQAGSPCDPQTLRSAST